MSITAFPAPTRLVVSAATKKPCAAGFERLGRVLPNLHLKVNNIWVNGWPGHTTVFAQWDGTATLLNGDASYFNRGLHVFTLRWGKVHAIDEFQDSQEAARALAAQAAAGLKEAAAEQIVSQGIGRCREPRTRFMVRSSPATGSRSCNSSLCERRVLCSTPVTHVEAQSWRLRQ
jgi:hypothetical protein